MRIILIILILLFYLFFFLRAFTLSKSLGKNIKAKNTLVNMSILTAGISTIIFICYLLFPNIGNYLFIFYSSDFLIFAGAFMVAIGLVFSSMASISLKRSWRIGIDENTKTELIENGLYKYSRNPYFLSYDLVLVGMMFCLISPFLIITVLLTILLFHLMILKEEKYLKKQHGESYMDYKKKVRRYI